jgi:hypothetical protein
MLLALQDELEKGAAIPGMQAARNLLSRQGSAIGAGAGLGAAVGGLGGLGVGGVRGYREAREQGASRGQAALMGLGRGAMGVGRGATVGALAGAGAGALSGQRGVELARELSGKEGLHASLARSGQRQLHSLTGWTPEAGLESVRGGAWGAKQRAAKALQKWESASGATGKDLASGKVRGLTKAPTPGAAEGVAHDVLDPKALKARSAARKEYELALQHQGAVEKSVEHGMTNLPGMYQALKGPNRMEALKAGVGAGWHGDTAAMKALNVGLPLGMVGLAAATSPKEERGQAVGREAGMAAAGMLSPFTVMPFVGGQVLARGAQAAGKTVGKGIDKLRNRHAGLPSVAQVPGTEGGDGGNPPFPIERNYSNSALGRPPEGMGV